MHSVCLIVFAFIKLTFSSYIYYSYSNVARRLCTPTDEYGTHSKEEWKEWAEKRTITERANKKKMESGKMCAKKSKESNL